MRRLNHDNPAVKTAKRIIRKFLSNPTEITKRPVNDLAIDIAIEIQVMMKEEIDEMTAYVEQRYNRFYPICYHGSRQSAELELPEGVHAIQVGEDEWYCKRIDSAHVKWSNEPEFKGLCDYHISQLLGHRFTDDIDRNTEISDSILQIAKGRS